MDDPAPDPQLIAHLEQLNKRRRALYERLLADPDYVELELHGRLAEAVEDEEQKVKTEQDPVKLLAARDRWLLALENRHQFTTAIEKYKLADRKRAEAADRVAKGLPPDEPNE